MTTTESYYCFTEPVPEDKWITYPQEMKFYQCLRYLYLIRNGDMKTDRALEEALIKIMNFLKKNEAPEEEKKYYNGKLSILEELRFQEEEPNIGEPKTGEPKTGEPKIGEPKTEEPITEQPVLKMSSKVKDFYQEFIKEMQESLVKCMEKEVEKQYPNSTIIKTQKHVILKLNIKGGTIMDVKPEHRHMELTRPTGKVINLGRIGTPGEDFVIRNDHLNQGSETWISRQHWTLFSIPTKKGCMIILKDNGSLNGWSLRRDIGLSPRKRFSALMVEVEEGSNMSIPICLGDNIFLQADLNISLA